VVDSIRRVTDIMSEIVAASVEQASGIEQVNHAMTQMDTVTQQNASLVEEAAAAAHAMEEQADLLAKVVSVFVLSAGQRHGGHAPRHAPVLTLAPDRSAVLPEARRTARR
jgi:methyl-accepting chemotaxis protein